MKYEKQTEKNLNAEENQNDDVKIVFTEVNNLPIEAIPLNKTRKGEHLLYDETNEVVYYNVEVQNMQKVLTIRSAFQLINSTSFTYYVKVW